MRFARALAFRGGVSGLTLAVVVGHHAAAIASDGVPGRSDIAWIVVVAVLIGLSGVMLVAGSLLWEGPIAWRLRMAGFLGLWVATLGSMSWVLPLFAPLAFLAVPSFVSDRRRVGA